MTDAIQAVVFIRRGWSSHSSWCADTLCIAPTLYDLRVVNVQRELLLYEFELGGSNLFCCAKGERAIDYSRWLKKFRTGCKNLDDQVRSGMPKIVDSEVLPKTTEANRASSSWRVSGELGILQFSIIHHLQKHLEVPNRASRINKILQNF